MSQISIAIGIRLGSVGGALGAAGEELTFDYHLSPWFIGSLDTLPDWTLINDAGGIRTVGGGGFYPQSQSQIGCCSWHPAGVFADCYGRFRCVDSWESVGDWMGVCLRVDELGAFDCYALRMGDEGRYLERYDDGVATILDSDLTVPIPGEVYEMVIVGSTISTTVNGAELFADVVDATYDEGYFGLICKGLDTDVEIDFVRFGPFPKGNAFTGVNPISHPLNEGETWYQDSCLITTPGNMSDGSFASLGLHAEVPHDVGGTDMHWAQWDFGKPFKTYGVDNYDHLSYHETTHITDCSWFGRNDEGDSWTQFESSFEMQNSPNPDWTGPHLWTAESHTYRYYRIEVYTTADVDNHWRPYEISFMGIPVS